MNNEPLYNKTRDILVQAYFNDTLQHSNCYACAVGNLVAANMRLEFIPGYIHGLQHVWSDRESHWDNVFATIQNKRQSINPDNYFGRAQQEIDSTGYTWQELAKIEFAFETAPKGNSDEDWMFKGLMAVLDVLDEIHGNTDSAITAASKQLFIKPATHPTPCAV